MNILKTNKKYYNVHKERCDRLKKFKPVKIDKIVISFRLNIDKLDQIDKLANLNDISRNELINQCLDYALKNIYIKKSGNIKK